MSMDYRVKKKKKKKKKQGTNSKNTENQFQCLPDDIVLNIFDELSDIKWLCRCFVVSKRFSYLIPRVQTVSVKRISFNKGLLGKDPPKLWPPFPLNVPGFEFLYVLTRIRSLNLKIDSDFSRNNDSVFKWAAKFTTKQDSVSFLYAKSLTKMMEKSEAEEGEIVNQISLKRMMRRVKLGGECLKHAVLWLAILSHVVLQHPTLQSITVTDSKNKGVKLCLAGEKLVEFRNAFHLDRVISLLGSWTAENIRVGYVPIILLPMSRYVMKGVTIIDFKLYCDGDSEADSAMVDGFAGEQGVFSEAMVQILKNHKDGIKAFNFYDQN
ncbi:F-box protein At1g30200-like [Rhododendron vialii]|uniref:F-box protein At1g30200-like n=1 Tax=Rhododendron vialii TaxID=182163 RepID=UPI00265F6215|nr:F-box protein At1g30200-like [Rhododendron vialii]